jgi:hypothetical protein
VNPIVLLAAIATAGIVRIRTILTKVWLSLVSNRPQIASTTKEVELN